MEHKSKSAVALVAVIFAIITAGPGDAQPTNTFTVASYNLENWILMERNGKPNQPKPPDEKQAVYHVLETIRPDVLGVAEMGGTNELAELASGLRERGLDYPGREWIEGANLDRHVALLSRFPIVARQSRMDYSYLLNGKPMRIERGILDVTIQVNDHYSFRAVMAHLKSKRTTTIGDQAVMRLEEARLLRRHVEAALETNSHVNMLVMGDFNDTPDSEAIRTIIGAAPLQLFDLNPVSSKGYHDTHYWRGHGEYSRIDYLLASPAMSNEFVTGTARIADLPGAEKGSDHRAIYAQFYDHEVGAESAPAITQPNAESQPVLPATQPVRSKKQQILIGIIVFDTLVIAGLAVALYRWRKSRRTPGNS